MNRFFCIINGRKVHYRKVGKGPTLVILHASPVSSQIYTNEYLPVFSKYFTCIVPDTPGNGYSDPLDVDNERDISDYAEALREFLNEIGVKDCLLYGRHTGALIAVEFAAKYPGRVQFVYCDGFPVFTHKEISSYTGSYLEPFEPDWAGGFLSWLWFRYRDQHVFWPWQTQDSNHLSEIDLPDLNFLQSGTLDLLLSGNNYLQSYLAAFKCAADPKISEVKTPVCYAIRPGDALYNIQDRIVGLPENSWMQEIARETEKAVQQELSILLQHREKLEHSVFSSITPKATIKNSMFLGNNDEQLFCRYNSALIDSTYRPLIVLPPISSGGSYIDTLPFSHLGNRDVVILDPPGHADSDFNGAHSIENYAEKISQILNHLDIKDFDVAAYGTGAFLALELQKIKKPKQIEVDSDIQLNHIGHIDRDVLDFSISWDGTHLIRLWHHIRDTTIWQGWNDRTFRKFNKGNWDLSLPKQYIKYLDSVKSINNYVYGLNAVSKYSCDYDLIDKSNHIIKRSHKYIEL